MDAEAVYFLNRGMNEFLDECFECYSVLSPGITEKEFLEMFKAICDRDALDPNELLMQATEIAKNPDREKRLSELTLVLDRALVHCAIAFDAMKSKKYLVGFYHALHFRSLLTCVGTILILDKEVSAAIKRKLKKRASDAGKKSKACYENEKEIAFAILHEAGRTWKTVEQAADYVHSSKKADGSEWRVSMKTLCQWIGEMPDRSSLIERRKRN